MSEKFPEHVARLLATSIESVERLEVLLHLRADATHTFTARSLATKMKLPIASLEHHLAILCGRGFLAVSIGNDLLYAYKPVSPSLDAVLTELADLYRQRRDDVVEALSAGDSKDSVRAFANAFLIRGRKGKRDA